MHAIDHGGIATRGGESRLVRVDLQRSSWTLLSNAEERRSGRSDAVDAGRARHAGLGHSNDSGLFPPSTRAKRTQLRNMARSSATRITIAPDYDSGSGERFSAAKLYWRV